jgi:hypothetical protein
MSGGSRPPHTAAAVALSLATHLASSLLEALRGRDPCHSNHLARQACRTGGQ